MKSPAVTVSSLSFSYGELEVLNEVSFDILEGDFVAVIGPNGAGKTTLMRLLLGLLSPTKGTVRVFSEDPRSFSKTGGIGYVPQRLSIDPSFPATVAELLSLCGHEHHDPLPKELGIDTFLDKPFRELSGGQQQKVLIALALLHHPKILILDEPTIGVDLASQRSLYEMLVRLHKTQGITIVMVTHEVGMVPSYASTVLCINHQLCCMGHANQTEQFVKAMYGTSVQIHHHHDDHEHVHNSKVLNLRTHKKGDRHV